MDKVLLLFIIGGLIGFQIYKSNSLKKNIEHLLIEWEVNTMYRDEILNVIVNREYRDNIKYLLAIGKVESGFDKFALGDPHAGYSYGYFQINLNDGPNHDKISTLEMAIREDKGEYSELANPSIIKEEMVKIRRGEKSFLHDTEIQFHLANNIINIAKKQIKGQGYPIKSEYIAYMWNVGVYSKMSNFNDWAFSRNYLEKFNKAYQEVEEALNSLLK